MTNPATSFLWKDGRWLYKLSLPNPDAPQQFFDNWYPEERLEGRGEFMKDQNEHDGGVVGLIVVHERLIGEVIEEHYGAEDLAAGRMVKVKTRSGRRGFLTGRRVAKPRQLKRGSFEANERAN